MNVYVVLWKDMYEDTGSVIDSIHASKKKAKELCGALNSLTSPEYDLFYYERWEVKE